MCGITGLWNLGERIGHDQCSAAVRRMTRSLTHRGPDDKRIFRAAGSGVVSGSSQALDR